MLSIITGIVGIIISLFLSRLKGSHLEVNSERDAFLKFCKIGSVVTGTLSIALIAISAIITVPAGHVKAATLFGEVQDDIYSEGIHIVNPLLDFKTFDLRQKTHKEERVGIPSEDKLITTMDVSIQYRIVGGLVPDILKNTGSTDALLAVHLEPKLRSILREQGKGVTQAQDFFKEAIQTRLQTTLQAGLADYLADKGLLVEAVLIRDVVLPKVIRDSIELTKEREQQQLLQQAELERFSTEQEQKVKQAEAEYDAALLDAKKIRELANAEAYKIEVMNKQLNNSPNYIELRRIEQWNGVLPVYSGGENTPMIDLR